ncbi:exo-poly-alpha-D-galacturonosidase [Mucilaginibacter sp. PPCGB 2223]|uniref:glycoside hydrolase family 28 protein n=1 Tax=Mucilaginibacter sp. PPCGB 2223 TaxID=1886027 RepID=UPI000826BF2E|nr:glycosyl hydrolase family 28 protein [Mucilaginibacter sp. PPCGB 2223]OCX51695.1 exo-poly-alpha-D-galacturonosidase [Mucilaginibacter sp. PPCGB 2223]
MKKKTLFYFVLMLWFGSSPVAKAFDPEPEWARLAGAHDAPYKKTVFKVSDYGAVNDGTTLNTKAIQKAIDACSSKGGGIVIFDTGKYLTGSLFLKENVRMDIGPGVEILGSQRIEDYPEIDTRVAGIEMKWPAALINVINKGSVAITGQGVIDAQGKIFRDKYGSISKEYGAKGLRWAANYDAKRPRTLLISESTNVSVRGVTFQQAAYETVQVLYSRFVTIDAIIIRNNTGDDNAAGSGIDIDSSSYVLVQNCNVDSNSDNFCLKAGRGADGLKVNRPTEYIVIRNSVIKAGTGLLTIGSETSGSIRHILVTNLVGNETDNGLNIKPGIISGGTIEDIHFQNITMNGGGTVIQISLHPDPADSDPKLPDGYQSNIPPHWKKLLTRVEPDKSLPHLHDVYLSGIIANDVKKAIGAEGITGSILNDFRLDNFNIHTATAGEVGFAGNWMTEKINITARDGSRVVVKNSERVVL